MSKKILIVVPHDDDLVLSFGALMSKAQRMGDEVYCYIFCMGGPSCRPNKGIRVKELEEVMQYFGINWYNYDPSELDGLLDTKPSSYITGAIDQLVSEIKPDELYCGAYSEHQDHIALYKGFLASCRLREGFMPKLTAVGTYPFSNQLYTDQVGGKIFQPMTDEDFNRKCEGFKLHKSQFKPSPSPLGLEGITNLAMYHGMLCGHKYAEMYYQLRYIRSL